MADSDITARGLLMLRLIPTFFTVVLVTLDTLDTPDTLDTMAMDSDTSTARGLLMLSLRLRLILTTLDMDTADTSTANRFHQDLSVNHRLDLRQKWIVISLKFPSPVLQFQCYHTKSLVMVSRKQENQSGKNPTNIKITKKKKKKKKKS